MLNKEKLTDMVQDLKIVESADNFEDILNNLSKDNAYYKMTLQAKESADNDSKEYGEIVYRTALIDLQAQVVANMEIDILTYLKEVL